MTWEEAECEYPGCSAAWDTTCQSARGDWAVQFLYVNPFDQLGLLVYSTASEFVSSADRKPCRAAIFKFGPGDLWWMVD